MQLRFTERTHYTGNSFPASAATTGIGGVTVSGSFAYTYYVGSSASGQGTPTAPSATGTYTVVANFTSSNSNYANATSTPVTFSITNSNAATPSMVVSDPSGTYSGKAFAATATASGARGVTVSGSFVFTYYVGTKASGTGSTTAPINVGTYTVVAAFTSSNSSYKNATSAAVAFTISPATPTVVVSDSGGTYSGSPFAAKATATGIGGATVGGSFSYTYYSGTRPSGAGTSTPPTNAGTYTVIAAFTSSNANYTNASSAPDTFTIKPATPTLVAGDPSGTYTGKGFTATATARGIGGVTVSGNLSFTYYAGSSASGHGSATPPSSVGTYTVVASFTSSNSNYGGATSVPVVFTIGVATPTVAVSDPSGPYTGKPFSASASASVGGTAVSGSFTYTYYVGSSVSGSGTSTAPSNAGTYTVVASFSSSNSNYTGAKSPPVTFIISPAAPTITAHDVGGTANGKPFPATATATGIGGATISGNFAFTYYVGSKASGTSSSTAPSAAGTYTVVASFTSTNSDYGSATSLPVSFTIIPAPSPHIAMTGRGIAIADGSTAASSSNDTAFGTTSVGGMLSETYTISNSGNANLSLGSVSIGGTNAGDFKVIGQPAGSVSPGRSTSFTIEFKPTGNGTRTATVSFNENDPTTTSPFSFAISGVASGSGPTPIITPAAALAVQETSVFGTANTNGTASSSTSGIVSASTASSTTSITSSGKATSVGLQSVTTSASLITAALQTIESQAIDEALLDFDLADLFG